MGILCTIAGVSCIAWIVFLTFDSIRADRAASGLEEKLDDYRVDLFARRGEIVELNGQIESLTAEVTLLKEQLHEERDRSCRAASLLLDDLPSSD